VEEPIRHTVSCAGAADVDVDPAVDEPPELQPAMARAAAATDAAIAADVFLSLTAGSPSGGPGGSWEGELGVSERGMSHRAETIRKLSYKIASVVV
jgi:hypothetical protein